MVLKNNFLVFLEKKLYLETELLKWFFVLNNKKTGLAKLIKTIL